MKIDYKKEIIEFINDVDMEIDGVLFSAEAVELPHTKDGWRNFKPEGTFIITINAHNKNIN